MMQTYEVVLHTHTGRRYEVEAQSGPDAVEAARRSFSEEGDDGEVLYDSIDSYDVKEIR